MTLVVRGRIQFGGFVVLIRTLPQGDLDEIEPQPICHSQDIVNFTAMMVHKFLGSLNGFRHRLE